MPALSQLDATAPKILSFSFKTLTRHSSPNKRISNLKKLDVNALDVAATILELPVIR